MSPPSSRQPDDPKGGGSDGSSSGRRQDLTMLEVRRPAAQPTHELEARRTIFGMAREALGLGQAAPAREPAQQPAARIAAAPVRSVGAAPLAPARAKIADLNVTAPQYGKRAGSLGQNGAGAAPPRQDAGVSPREDPPLNAAQVARSVPTPMSPQPLPAAESRAAQAEPRQEELTPYSASPLAGEPYQLPKQQRPERTPELRQPLQAAPAAQAGSVSPYPPPQRGQAQALPRSGPDGVTAFVDMRQLVVGSVELPAVGRADDSSEWNAQAAVDTAPAVAAPLRSAKSRWAGRLGRADETNEAVDLNLVLGRRSSRTLLLVAGCIGALAIAGMSFFARDGAPAQAGGTSAAVRPTTSRAPSRSVASAPALGANGARQPEQELTPPRREESKQARTAQRTPERPGGEAAAGDLAAAEPQPIDDAQPRSGEPARGAHISASPERAAGLYIGGKYKEALAEYRLLAAAYPKQRVYGELARILKRKVVETCLRTQPNRREQCKEL